MPTLDAIPALGRIALLAATAVAVALLLHAVLAWTVRRVPGYPALREAMVRSSRRPLRLLLVLLALGLALPFAGLPPAWEDGAGHALLVAAIVVGAWLLIGLSHLFQFAVESRYPSDVSDNLRARRIRTKVRLLRRVVAVVVSVLAFGLVLTTFPAVRRVGISLFASAGAAGIVLGVAAQPTLSNLVAGLQLALTEPIRLDDVVIVNGEWGWIEEVNTTYVVVRVWDLRRLIVPIRWFIENPFENWTRTTSDILGSVFLYVDYRAPLDAMRAELERVVAERDEWDGRVCNLQVVDATERTLRVRALVSAASSPAAWDLRCAVREALAGFLRDHHPEALPRTRALVAEEEGGLDRPLPPNAMDAPPT